MAVASSSFGVVGHHRPGPAFVDPASAAVAETGPFEEVAVVVAAASSSFVGSALAFGLAFGAVAVVVEHWGLGQLHSEPEFHPYWEPEAWHREQDSG